MGAFDIFNPFCHGYHERRHCFRFRDYDRDRYEDRRDWGYYEPWTNQY